jgi:hypothetical protein
MFSTTRLSPGLSTAGWLGGAPCAISREAVIKVAVSKTAERNLSRRKDSGFKNSSEE